MNEPYKIATKLLLEPTGLTRAGLRKILSKTMGPGVDYADLYLQYSQREAWALEEGIVKRGSFLIDQGIGVRAISGEKTGSAYSDELVLPAIKNAANFARGIAKSGKTKNIKAWRKQVAQQLYLPQNPITTLSETAKVGLLKRIDLEAKRCDPRVELVVVNLLESFKVFLVMSSDGCLAADVRPSVHLEVSAMVVDKGRREYGSDGIGKCCGLDFFTDEVASKYAHEAVRRALNNLEAIPAPAGIMPVVLGPGWPAVMLHEAVGHGLEADFNRKNRSVYAGKIGEKVASANCTLVDQGNLPGQLRGSVNIDDEGTATQRTVLIKNGILRGYLQDKLNARLMKMKPTGNGRRSSYAQIPLPRMTNTYLLGGKYDPQEIIASVNKGIYAVNLSGGQVDTVSGSFVFSAKEAYLIEKGKVTRPVKDATLIGNGPEVLHKIAMVGNDLEMDSGQGSCSKSGQGVPVGVGQPTLKVSELVVGGTVVG